MGTDVFVSVGTGLSEEQERFVLAVEARLRAVGLNPRTIGRNTFSADAPLHAVTDLMNECAGAVVIALERFRFPSGEERPGSTKSRSLQDVSMPTAWNQIEAAMAYSRGLPLLVIVDETLRADGLLERGNDWYVQEISVDPAALDTPAFAGILQNWHARLRQQIPTPPTAHTDPGTMTIGELLGALRPAQMWSSLSAIAPLGSVCTRRPAEVNF